MMGFDCRSLEAETWHSALRRWVTSRNLQTLQSNAGQHTRAQPCLKMRRAILFPLLQIDSLKEEKVDLKSQSRG